MRFIKARTAQGDQIGVLRPDGTVALARHDSRLEPYFGDDGTALHRLGETVEADPAAVTGAESLQLRAPVEPVSMRDFMVFEEHALPAWRRHPPCRHR